MHSVEITEGIVLAKRGIREADLLLDLLTPAGLLRARALGARKEASKLRYGLEPLSRGRYSLVRAREVRLTGVSDVSRAYAAAPAAARAAIARVARLLLRLVAGTEPSAELFSTVSDGFAALALTGALDSGYADLPAGKSAEVGSPSLAKPPPSSLLSSLEIVLVLRVLSHLGYLPQSEALAPFVDGAFSVELSAQALERKALLVRTINESLRATGL